MADLIKVVESDLGGAWLFEAVIDDKLVGMANVTAQGEIAALLVDPTYRRRGVATVLLEEIEESAAKRGLRRVFANVCPDNKGSRAFWKSRGYGELMRYEMWLGDEDATTG